MSRYSKSEEWLRRAEKTIPLGSQTFSKSRTQYPVGISPLYIDKAQGCHVWDLDGNKYIDLVSSLASVTLGYNDRGVNSAVKKQLRKGVSFSLPGRLEAEVAELICEMVPSAELVRFGKNGTDATSAAVRLARAYTGRDHVAVCGYHGWQDWYIGSTTRNKGVPDTVSALTHKFEFNDVTSLESILEEYSCAAIILEPMNSRFPEDNFLEKVRELATKYDAVLIFDETITGFRFSAGGAQELFSVIPDLSTFGKGMANGFPISAVVGKAEIMQEMQNIFFSGTFGGELLSLAAANYVMKKIQSGNVIKELETIGDLIATQLENLIREKDLLDVLQLSGHGSWKFLNWSSSRELNQNELKTYFMQEIFEAGVLVLGTHNISLAHGPKEQRLIIDAYDRVLTRLSRNLNTGELRKMLKVQPLEPLFKVR